MKEKKDHFHESIERIESIIGYTFRDKSLLTQAFTRTSYCNENLGRGGQRLQSNEVLEFFGDGVLSVAIISHMMSNFAERYDYGIKTELGEGDFSNIKSKLSDKKNLSECILRLGLEKFLRMGEGDAKLGIGSEPSVMEDLFESIIGAVYIDCDMNIRTVIAVVSRMLDISAYNSEKPPIQSSKNALQEWCADKKRRLGQPIYRTLSEEGPDHKKVYERGVFLGERMIASAKGKNLKLADAAAADAALKLLKKEESSKANEGKPKYDNSPKANEGKPKYDNSPKAVSGPVSEKSAKPKSAVKAKAAESSAKNSGKVSSSSAPTHKSEAAVSVKAAPTHKSEAAVSVKGASQGKGAAGKAKSAAKEKKAVSATPKKSGTVAKSEVKKQESASSMLKKHASARKGVTPTFKDLGEQRNGGMTECRVECIYMGESVTGFGATRPEAKEAAAAAMLSLLAKSKSKAAAKHK